MSKINPDTEAAASGARMTLTLFIAGQTLYSQAAIENLNIIVKALSIEVAVAMIDVLNNPQAAIDNRVYATPALLARSDARAALFVGDLAERDRVIRMLRTM